MGNKGLQEIDAMLVGCNVETTCPNDAGRSSPHPTMRSGIHQTHESVLQPGNPTYTFSVIAGFAEYLDTRVRILPSTVV
jgi:hypothetical protein